MVLAMFVVAMAAGVEAAQVSDAQQGEWPEGVVMQTQAAAGQVTPRSDGLPYSVARIRQTLSGERRIYRGVESPLTSNSAHAGPTPATFHPRMSRPASCQWATTPLSPYRYPYRYPYPHVDSWQEALVVMGLAYLEAASCQSGPRFSFDPIGAIKRKIRRGKENRARQEILAELAELARVNKARAGISGTNAVNR